MRRTSAASLTGRTEILAGTFIEGSPLAWPGYPQKVYPTRKAAPQTQPSLKSVWKRLVVSPSTP